MKKKYRISLIIGIVIFAVVLIRVGYSHFIEEKSYEDPLLRVVTQSEETGEIGYYEIGNKEKYLTCEAFEPQKCMVYRLSSATYLNQDLAAWIVYDSDANEVEKDEIWLDMLRKVSDKEQEHNNIKARVFETDEGIYYIQVVKNVNLWTPYVLYRYEPKSGRLTYLTTFSDMEVIGLQE